MWWFSKSYFDFLGSQISLSWLVVKGNQQPDVHMTSKYSKEWVANGVKLIYVLSSFHMLF